MNVRRLCIDIDKSFELHFVAHGEKHLALGNFAASIEDDREQACAFLEADVPAYLIAHPWNVLEQESGLVSVKDWTELVDMLIAND
jgi:hypothetical protein